MQTLLHIHWLTTIQRLDGKQAEALTHPTNPERKPAMQTTYSVPGISCSHCRWAINRQVDKVTGVTDVDVDIDAKQVTVTGAFDDAQVRDAIDDAGYDVA